MVPPAGPKARASAIRAVQLTLLDARKGRFPFDSEPFWGQIFKEDWERETRKRLSILMADNEKLLGQGQ